MSFRDPKALRQTQKWLFVSDVTSATRLCKKTHSKKPKTAPSAPPDPDGNGQFAAMADQLPSLGIFSSPQSSRDEIVQDLRNYPYNGNGTLLFNVVEGNDWDGYLERMARTGTYGGPHYLAKSI